MAFKQLAILAFAAFFAILATVPASSEPYKIVGFGDSLMAGFGLGPGEGFPEKLQAALQKKGHDVVIANAGVSGDTTSGGLSRLDWSVPDNAQLVILELGANDMLRGIAPEVTEKNLDAMIARLKQRGMAVLLVGMVAAPNLGPDYAAAFNGIFPRLAEKHNVAFYPFFLDGVAADRTLLLEDGMHPNTAGIDLMVERVLPLVEKLIAAKPNDS
ncbi:acyl-CoA thioesterase-1 [Mesorhizobium albiziae]|uniref:Acyl-CoA thioesterase-1 n=1 Tax=Neomesorhizobium albiziae TaxID=335020 RepID=A0A1I3Y2I4_9HYPH|nr:arylesterase [Mesorhizobium albiziae]GLS30132.1 arylesterase [Mesorhizobium albiziae]SFK26137.1 acyl-CoA thioesterase-1 [Mesorhizobium albiziae]